RVQLHDLERSAQHHSVICAGRLESELAQSWHGTLDPGDYQRSYRTIRHVRERQRVKGGRSRLHHPGTCLPVRSREPGDDHDRRLGRRLDREHQLLRCRRGRPDAVDLDRDKVAAAMRHSHRDQRGQSLVIVLSLITLLFLLGSSLAVHASVALRTTRTSAGEGNDFYAADAATELGIWWQRNGKAGNPPAQTINGITTSTTVTSTPGAGGTCPASPTPDWISGMESGVFYKYVNNVTNVYTMPRPSDNGIPAGGWYDKGGDVTIVTTPVRTGTYALRVHSTASVGAYAATRFATPYPTSAVMRFSVRLDSLPTQDADLARLAVTGGTNYTVLHVFYKATTQKYALGWGWANPTLVQESTVTATTGTWASFDVRVSANNQNPRTADWYVNDISQPSLSATDTANATNVSTWYVGY